MRTLLALLLCASIASATNRHVVASGGVTSGIAADSAHGWTIVWAISSSNSTVSAGDTVWIHGGQYNNPHDGADDPAWELTKSGSSGSPIIYRVMRGQRASFDGKNTQQQNILEITGDYVWVWGWEIYSSDPPRVAYDAYADPDGSKNWSFPLATYIRRGNCISTTPSSTTGIKVINCILHDGFVGLGNTSAGSDDFEIYGTLSFNNGWNGVGGDRPHGHNFYVQNHLGQTRTTYNCIVWGSYENDIQYYGGDGTNHNTDDFDIRKLIAFNPGEGRAMLVGGATVSENLILDSCVTYNPGSNRNLDLGWVPYGAGVNNGRVTYNWFVGGEMNVQGPITSTDVSHNTFYTPHSLVGFSTGTFPNNRFSASIPDTVFVFPNAYEPGRAHIAIYNGSNASTVGVNLSLAGYTNGDLYVIKDAQNPYGPNVASGTYGGSGTVSIPMGSRTVQQPVSGDTQNGDRVSSFPYFAALILQGTATGEVEEPPATPTITVSTTSLSGFGSITYPGSSSSQNYTVSGSDLTDSITVTAPGGYQVSTDNSNWYGSRILTQSGGTVGSTTIYVRFTPTGSGYFSGYVTHTSSGATTRNVSVNGTGVVTPTPSFGRRLILRR